MRENEKQVKKRRKCREWGGGGENISKKEKFEEKWAIFLQT